MVDSLSPMITVPTEIKYPDYFKGKKIVGEKLNIVFAAHGQGIALYEAKRPVKVNAGETQNKLDKMIIENDKLRKRVLELERKISRIGEGGAAGGGGGSGGGNGAGESSAGGQNDEINKDLNSDKIMRKLKNLIT